MLGSINFFTFCVAEMEIDMLGSILEIKYMEIDMLGKVYHFANGHCYEGSWHEGRKQGFGMYTFPNGYSRCGEWNFGSLKTSFPPPLTDATLRAVQVICLTYI